MEMNRLSFLKKNMNSKCCQALQTSNLRIHDWLLATLCLLFYLLFIVNYCDADESIAVLANDVSRDEKKFLIYDVNYGEGFNLRRDVFVR